MMPETQFMDFNSSERQSLEFAKRIPTRLDVIAGKLQWIISAEVFTDGGDFSHWNDSEGREPDFDIFHDNGFDFVILKATESNWFIDPAFDKFYRQAHDSGLVSMIYHFNRGDVSGIEQAEWCLTNVEQYLKAVDGKTVIFSDLETMDGVTTTRRQNVARRFNETIVREGFKTGNYSSYYLWQKLMGNAPLSWVNKYLQWVAHWTPAASPLLPIGWTKAMTKFWQYGIWPTYSWAKYVGTDGNVDVNRFYGTPQELKDLLGIVPPIPPDCCDEIKGILVEVIDEIALMNGRLITVEASQESMLSIINMIDTELGKLKVEVAANEVNDQITRERVDTLIDLVNSIRALLCNPAL